MKILSIEKERQGNKIIETTKRELPLYEVRKVQASWWWENGEGNDLLLDKGIKFCLPKWKGLHSIDVDKYSDNPIKEFIEQIENKQDYNFYYIQEYNHSGSSFYLTETSNKIDQWDSSMVGFCAIPKSEKLKISDIDNTLTDLWNGSIDAYEIWNNETDDIEEVYEVWANSTSSKDWAIMCEDAKKKYDIDLEAESERLF